MSEYVGRLPKGQLKASSIINEFPHTHLTGKREDASHSEYILHL